MGSTLVAVPTFSPSSYLSTQFILKTQSVLHQQFRYDLLLTIIAHKCLIIVHLMILLILKRPPLLECLRHHMRKHILLPHSFACQMLLQYLHLKLIPKKVLLIQHLHLHILNLLQSRPSCTLPVVPTEHLRTVRALSPLRPLWKHLAAGAADQMSGRHRAGVLGCSAVFA